MYTQPSRIFNASPRFATLFPITFLSLLIVYGLWLIALWPGVLGEDSLAIIWETEQAGQFFSGKPAFWFYFINTFYGSTGRVEVPIAIQLCLMALVYARILAWCWTEKLWKTAIFLSIFIALAPRMVVASSTLYPDGSFSVAATGLLFEAWYVISRRRLAPVSFCILVIVFPFAIFTRANGIVLLIPILVALRYLKGRDRIKLGALAFSWCTLVGIGAIAHKTPAPHNPVFSLAIYETVNFLQPRPMNLRANQPRVSDKAIQTISRYSPIENVLRYYDRDYWDPLVFNPKGPHLGSMSKKDQRAIMREFFRYNLWHNIPAFMGSRVNIFLVSALAQGGEVGLDYSFYVLPQTHAISKHRELSIAQLTKAANYFLDITYPYRWIFWTPLLGVGLLLLFARQAWRDRAPSHICIALTMLIQLLAIFFFSIAGEYRYLLPFFTLPMAILPILSYGRTRNGQSPEGVAVRPVSIEISTKFNPVAARHSDSKTRGQSPHRASELGVDCSHSTA